MPNNCHFTTVMSNERGATSLEYGIVISLIAAVVAVAVSPLGTAVADLVRDGAAAFA